MNPLHRLPFESPLEQGSSLFSLRGQGNARQWDTSALVLGMSPIIEYQLPCQPAGLLRAASDDVMGGSFDPFLAVGQPTKGLDQFRLTCLFGVIIQQL